MLHAFIILHVLEFPVEAAVVELMEVTLEEVFNEEGNITIISGVLSSPLVSTSVPASALCRISELSYVYLKISLY